MGYRILLVDDDAAHRLVATRAINKLGVGTEVVECGSVSSALKALNAAGIHVSDSDFNVNNISLKNGPLEQKLDLAVIDLKLDHENGLDVLRSIREFYSLDSFPVIIISTSDLYSHIEESYRMGANCYVVKGAEPLVCCANLYKAIKFFLNDTTC